MMNKALGYLCFIIWLHSAFCLDYDGWLNIKIEHSINCNNNKYCLRGNISLKSIRSGASVIEQIDFNQKHIDELEELGELDGFYTIKTTVSSGENAKGIEFLSSMKAKAFLENGLSDVINAWVLPSGGVVAVSFQTTNNTQSIHNSAKSGNRFKINSNFYLRYIDQAPVPDTASYIQKLEREREAREKGEVKDNRSFLAKYWMYIVPFAIFVMISGATNPESAAR